jgi:chromosomal replication initiator protein
MVLTPYHLALARQIKQITQETAEKHNISTEYLLGHTRRAGVAWARFEVMWRARHELNAPYQLIGHVLGGRDHTTIMHGIKRYENR